MKYFIELHLILIRKYLQQSMTNQEIIKRYQMIREL